MEHLSAAIRVLFCCTVGLFFSAVLGAQTLPSSLSVSGTSPQAQVTNIASVGSTFTFSVSASGTAPFAYRWSKGGVDISGAVTSPYTINPVSADSAGSYTVTVTNSAGSVTSMPFTLVVREPAPVITQQPVSVTIAAGQTLSLTAAANGTPPFIFTWYKNNQNVAFNQPSTTSNTYLKTNAQLSDAGSYFVRIENPYLPSEVAQSATVTVTVSSVPPIIIQQPVSQTATYLKSTVLSAIADGAGASLTYRWFKDGVSVSAIPGLSVSVNQAFPNLNIGVMQPEHAGTYRLTVSNAAGQSVSTDAITLSISSGLSIGSHPASQTVNAGSAATFTVVANYETPFPGSPSYRWRKNGVDIAGATSSTLTIPNVQSADEGSYSALVYYPTAAGVIPQLSVISNTASLTVTSPRSPPSISTQPISQTVSAGTPTSFAVVAFGTAPLTYQWRKNGVNIPGAIAATFSLPSVQTSDVANYSVVISNSVSSVTSSDASLSLTTSAAPVISVQPTSQIVATGATVTFSITATGSTPLLSYAWFRNGQLQPGLLPTFTLTNVSAVDAGDYYVRVANMTGESVNSQTFSLTVLAPTNAPTILTQPAPQTAAVGGSATFLVSATGTPLPSYQWYKRGSGAIAGATGPSFILTTIASGDAGDFYVVVTNSAGSATSSDARLTVVAAATAVAPSIVQEPTAQNVVSGDNATFTVIANGNPAPTYQWYFNGGAIAAATSSSFSRTNAAASDAGSYYVRVTNSAGSITSAAVLLSVLAPEDQLSITTQPVSKTVGIGSSVTFSVGVKGPAALNYQWFKDGQPLTGATQASLTLSNVQSAQAGSYHVTISSRLTAAQQIVTSASASLVVTAEPLVAILTQPIDQSVLAGDAASFSVVASGTAPLAYQWLRNGATINGATHASYVIPNAQLTDSANYSVVVSDSGSSVISSTARLTVNATAFTGIYFGKLGPDGSSGDFAVTIKADGSGAMLLYLPGSKTGIVVTDFKVNPNGTFAVNGTVLTPASVDDRVSARVSKSSVPAVSGSISGSLDAATGGFTGTIAGLDVVLAGSKVSSSATSTSAGFYQAVALNGATGAVYTLVAPDGRALVVAQTASSVDGGVGKAASSGSSSAVSVTTAGGATVTTTIDANSGSVSTAVDKGPLSGTAFSGLRDDVVRTDRLANISSRGNVTASDLMIAGFVINGSIPKSVMIRATGPALDEYGIKGVVPNPKLELYRGLEKIEVNDDWSNASNVAEVVTTAGRTGAFPLISGSRDAVLLTTLSPGSYTALVSSADSTPGIALVEVYDANPFTDHATNPRLINISTRANVKTGEGLLIAGVAITGNSPKKILIRAIGPALAAYHVTDVLSDPQLKLLKGGTVIAQNDNWSDSPTQAQLIAAANSATGAFPLADGAKDSAMLVTLEPGNYTAQVTGIGETVGNALIEVYEVP